MYANTGIHGMENFEKLLMVSLQYILSLENTNEPQYKHDYFHIHMDFVILYGSTE